MSNQLPKELLDEIYAGEETQNCEYKESMDWSDRGVKDNITKEILGMANVRDGGIIIIGVGKKMDDMNQQDDVSRKVAEFADPYAKITVLNSTSKCNTRFLLQNFQWCFVI